MTSHVDGCKRDACRKGDWRLSSSDSSGGVNLTPPTDPVDISPFSLDINSRISTKIKCLYLAQTVVHFEIVVFCTYHPHKDRNHGSRRTTRWRTRPRWKVQEVHSWWYVACTLSTCNLHDLIYIQVASTSHATSDLSMPTEMKSQRKTQMPAHQRKKKILRRRVRPRKKNPTSQL